jgi:hypothetical protein
MPAGNRRGPVNDGPMTGRGLGYCTGYAEPGFTKTAPGRGMGRGLGRGSGKNFGFGFRRGGAAGSFNRGFWGFPQTGGATSPSKEETISMLKEESNYYKQNLDELEKRIAELEKDNSNDNNG